MPLWIRSPAELESLRRVGVAARRVLDEALHACRPGTQTREIDERAAALIDDLGARSVQGVEAGHETPFPGHLCINVNEEAAHAIPGDRILRAGDLVSIDVAIRLDGWWADVAEPVVVGGADDRAGNLAMAARAITDAGIDAIGPGARWSDAVRAIHAEAALRSVRLVAGLDGHAIGRSLHETPSYPLDEALAEADDVVLRPGMVLTVEPTVTDGTGATLTLDDAWTVVTEDRGWCCFRERTIAVTRRGAIDLTRPGETG